MLSSLISSFSGIIIRADLGAEIFGSFDGGFSSIFSKRIIFCDNFSQISEIAKISDIVMVHNRATNESFTWKSGS